MEPPRTAEHRGRKQLRSLLQDYAVEHGYLPASTGSASDDTSDEHTSPDWLQNEDAAHLPPAQRPPQQSAPVAQVDASGIIRTVAGSGYAGFGGSDAHLVSLIGICATEFDRAVRTTEDLVTELREGSYRPLDFRERLRGDRNSAAEQAARPAGGALTPCARSGCTDRGAGASRPRRT